MDLICCRNILIYLESDVQKRLLPLLHYALKTGGILFLGPSETAGESADLFTLLDRKWKIYQRREAIVSVERLRFPAAFAPGVVGATRETVQGIGEVRIPELTEKIFLDNYAPTFAVIDEKFRLIYIRGRTGKYLELASGQPSLSVIEMAREGLRTELNSAIYRASAEKRRIIHEGVRVKTNGGFQTINLTVVPLTEAVLPPGLLMIVFQEVTPTAEGIEVKPAARSRKRVVVLEDELRLTKENLQTTIEELEATNEELKSANEELQSNNEELQSTNEELDTSREELQSLNEELTTLNAELQDKNELLSKANDDLKNFLNRTDIAIIFLDDELKIRSYTPATSDVFNVRDIDVGRPLDEITSRLAYVDIVSDAREVLRTLRPKEIEVQRKDGCWYKMRILPYFTAQNVVSGLVMSFLDIDDQKKATDELRKAHDGLETRVKERTAELQQTNKRLKEENEERLRTEQSLRLEEARLEALLQLSHMSEASVDETAEFILEHGIALTQSKIGFVGFLSEDESVYTLHAVSKDVVKECAVEGNPLQWHVAEAGIWADAIRKRKTLFVNDYSEPHPMKKGLPAGHPPVSRLMIVPLPEGNRIVAVAGMGNKDSAYDEPDARQITLLLQGMWNQAQRKRSADALKEARDKLEQRVEQRTKELTASNAALQEEVTERKKAEEDLRETRDYLDNLFNYANAPIIVLNPELKITRFNHAFEQLTGRSSDEMLDKKVDILIPPERRDDALEQINRTTIKGERWEVVEIPVQHVDGSVRTMLWNSATIFGADGETPVATIAQGTDITEQKEEMRIKDDFIGMVSHELRTPLTVIIGALSTARDERASPEEIRELIAEASSSAESLSTILNNMLELSRHQAGQLNLEKKSCRIDDIAEMAIRRVTRKYDSHKMVLDFPKKITNVTCDPVRIEEVLYNLLENAIKYSLGGTEVRVFGRQEKEDLVIGISDRGVGISSGDQLKLFEPFSRIGGGNQSGVGLGLVVCKRLVEAHGGHIWVESKLGEGSTFLFTIPQGKEKEV
jgi:PAS domain S-box-containing protein